MTEKISVQLDGVPETLLWPLYNRALEAKRPDALLHDPRAVEIADSIQYPFRRNFGRQDERFTLRALRFDEEIRRFLTVHPEGTVVALGEGLETQFFRVDNGTVKWLAVDLPESIAVRGKFIPDTERHCNFACSALDSRWMKEVDPSKGVFITAAGLLMYFKPRDAKGLITECGKNFPGAQLMFNPVPRWLSRLTLRGFMRTPNFRVPPMPWGMNVDELDRFRKELPQIEELKIIETGAGRSMRSRFGMPLLRMLPRLRNQRFYNVLITFRSL